MKFYDANAVKVWGGQCDQMVRLFADNWPSTKITIYPKSLKKSKVCSQFCQILNKLSRNCQSVLFFIKWQKFAKFGHTGGGPLPVVP